MLQELRNQTSSWVIKILLGMLVISFAVWGINDIFLGERDPAVITIGDVKLPRSQVNDEIREEMNRLQPLFGGRLDRAEADRMGITGQVVENIVNRTAVALGAHDLGVIIPDALVAQRITSDETFFNNRGKFDRAIFMQVLSRSGMNEAYYVANLKRDLAASEINRAISSAVPVPGAMIEPLVGFRSERRVAKSFLVPFVPANKVAEPSDAEVETYYKANSQRFMSPELRDVSWIHLDPAVLAAEIRVSDEKIKQAYQDRHDEFTTRDRRELEQVVFASQAAAEAAAVAIKAGKSLAEAAKEDGKAKKPLALGWVDRRDMLPELAGPVFALKKGAYSAPVKTALGWHIVRVKDVQTGRTKPLAEVREQLKKDIARHDAGEAVFALANKLEDALAAGGTLEEAARQINLRAGRAEAIDRRGRDLAGEAVSGLPKSAVFLRIAFKTADGQDSALTESEGGGFMVVHVNKVTAPAVRPLKDIRAKVISAWKNNARDKATEVHAKKLADSIRAGKKIEAVARGEKLKVKTSKPFTRLTHDAESGLPAALMQKLFTLKTGEAALSESTGGFTVAVLTEIRAPDAKERKETTDALGEEIRQALGGDLFQQFIGAMRAQYPAEVRTNLLQQNRQ
jgi:peptidyl-prolyl cis-trans isomerase D